MSPIVFPAAVIAFQFIAITLLVIRSKLIRKSLVKVKDPISRWLFGLHWGLLSAGIISVILGLGYCTNWGAAAWTLPIAIVMLLLLYCVLTPLLLAGGWEKAVEYMSQGYVILAMFVWLASPLSLFWAVFSLFLPCSLTLPPL